MKLPMFIVPRLAAPPLPDLKKPPRAETAWIILDPVLQTKRKPFLLEGYICDYTMVVGL
jgi:hypothetical protein